jgi:hypothetical protein
MPRRTACQMTVYSSHDDDPAQQWTEVYWLLW